MCPSWRSEQPTISKSNAISPDVERMQIAYRVAEEYRAQLADKALAVGVYGSVAHGASGEDSDLEMVVLTEEDVRPAERHFFRSGVLVACSARPVSIMLASAQEVGNEWGIRADAYRYHLPIWDPGSLFPQVWEAAQSIPEETFEQALQESWWWNFEALGKVRNALRERENARSVYRGWRFAYACAMRIALHDREPYESGRVLWQNASMRGYGLAGLVEDLTRGDVRALSYSVETAWVQVGDWGAPPVETGSLRSVDAANRTAP